MAAARLADELLQIILAPSLTISQCQFVSDSSTAFGKNDAVSSASVLLVCKRWLRVATPMLYETVIIRSAGQSRALAAVFRYDAAFSKYVKKLRLEGAYQYLGDILPPCTNLVTLVLLLNIYSDANVTGLCRSLPLINPVEMILLDKWIKDNNKVRKVFSALYDAIPKWTKLTSFEFPYGQRSLVEPGSTVSRNDRLIHSLAQSKSLRTFYGNLSQFHGGHWLRLARVSSITFRFRYFSRPGLDLERLEMRARKETSDLANTFVEFIESPKATIPEKCKPSVELAFIPTFNNFSFEAIDDHIWSTVLTFAALPGHPNPPDMYRADFHHEGAEIFNPTCKALSLTCKRFKRLIDPILFAFPLILSSASLEEFTKIILDTQGLGSRVRIITFHIDPYPLPAGIKEQLHTLVPHLTRLLGFNCQRPWELFGKFALTTKALELLAEASRDTLVTLTGFKFLPTTAPSLAAFTPFKSLRTLHLPSNGSHPVHDTLLAPGCFANVHTLRIDGPGLLFNELCKLSLPALRSVSFRCARAGTVEKLFEKSGSMVEELVFSGMADLGHVFSLAPKLLRVDWDPDGSYQDTDSAVVCAAFNGLAAHKNLEKLTLRKIPRRAFGQKEQNTVVDTVFSRLKFSNFPSLKEIHFQAYRWPVDERSISKQLLPKYAVTLKQAHDIEIKDGSGKPWRVRA